MTTATLAALSLAAGPASATWSDIGTTRYASGGSGTVAASMQFDTGLNQFRSRGAADPNPGYGIYLRTIELHENSSNPPAYDRVVASTGGGNSMSYQSYVTAGYYASCAVYYTNVYYSTVAGNFLLQSYSDQRCSV